MKHALLLGTALLLIPSPVVAQGKDAAGIQFFESKIRPVLVTHCYECHSAQSKKLRADLLLDTRAGVLNGGVSGPALVAGKAKESLLIKALKHEGDTRMPKNPLAKEVIADFVKWVDMGAPDPREGKVASGKREIDIARGREFWSFRPLADVPVPAVKNAQWAKTPVDRFILAKLEEKQIAPNGMVGKERLLRRAYYDITGLPPAPIEVEAFLADSSPDAFARVVDRLLQSERFGERWARHWLDVVRFAESGGYEFDKDRPSAHHYRDFVIKAFNQDMPYDEFVRLQIAGDVLKPGNFDAHSATGFLVAGPFPGQMTSKTMALIRYDHLDDMMATLGSSMLGLSLGCARCHEHKYDPIPQEDYYRLIANLGRTDSIDAKINTDPENYKKAKDAFDLAHTPFLKARDEYEQREATKRLQALFDMHKDKPAPTWLILDTGMEKLAPKKNIVTMTATTVQKKIKGIRLQGKASLKEVVITATPLNPAAKAKIKPVTLKPKLPAADKEVRILPLETDLGFDGGTTLSIAFTLDEPRFNVSAVAITTAPAAKFDDPAEPQLTTELMTLLYPSKGAWKAEQRSAIAPWLRKLDARAEEVYAAVDAHAKKEPQPKLVNVFSATGNRGGDVHFLIRGETEKKREKVSPGYAQVLTRGKFDVEPKQDPRTGLANWLTDAENGAGHLAARVIVNRLWQHYFGKGIVGTPNDFGVQGDAPTHPELLDYLARELVKNGWRLKPIHKLIVTSAVYQTTGDATDQQVKADPANKLWWRHPTRRLEAEAIRDAVLAVAGTLDTTMYGPGTLNAASQRRSVYLTVKRSQMVPLLAMFDMPEALQSIGERSVTTVPTQSLAFMNSPLVRQSAQKFAARIKAGNEPARFIEQAYLAALARRPTDNERERMQSFIDRQAASYGATPQAREQALVDFCQVMLCLNEFIYID